MANLYAYNQVQYDYMQSLMLTERNGCDELNRPIENVTIVGSGVQGSMLAFRSALYNKNVCIYDIDLEAAQRAVGKIEAWLSEYAAAGKIDKNQMESSLRRVRVSSDIRDALKDADLVIENVPERLELKQRVWETIDALAPDKTLLTTNSSSLRSSQIGINVSRKEKTFNLNFMTPTIDDLVEVMWNFNTSEESKSLILAFLLSNSHIPIITNKEIKGFSLNRVWRVMKKECLKLWAEGYIKPEDLDRAFMMEWATDHGPFGLMDKVGLDVVRDIEYSYYNESGDQSDIPPKALSDMIEKGWLGEKSGKGFYDYPDPAYQRPDFLRKGSATE
jgi:3-hydroxybutyryl-CoA dehydrogenase